MDPGQGVVRPQSLVELKLQEELRDLGVLRLQLDCEIIPGDDIRHQPQLTEGSVRNLLTNPVLAANHQMGGLPLFSYLGEAEEPLDCGKLDPVHPGGVKLRGHQRRSELTAVERGNAVLS